MLSLQDCISAPCVRLYLNNKFKHYGLMTRLEIDSKNKKISLEVELKGETQPIQLETSNYKLLQKGGQTFIELGEIKCSREWVTMLLAENKVREKIKEYLQSEPLPYFSESNSVTHVFQA